MPRALRRLAVFLGALAAFVTPVWFWYTHRPQPPDEVRTLFDGVSYRRESRRSPRPLVLHRVVIDLTRPGIGLLVTPPDDPKRDLPLGGRTTTRFAREHRVQLAVNGDFFYPWRSRALWDYYPKAGQPVRPEGDAASRGVLYCRRHRGGAQPTGAETKLSTLWVSKDNRARVSEERPRTGEVYNAIGGHELYQSPGDPPRPDYTKGGPQPSVAVGVDAGGRRLILLVVDGRQPNYSEGVTANELADLMREFGAEQALQLDGGGSATLVVTGSDGTPRILNSPIDNRIPGRERVVANHLGVFARPAKGGVP